MIIEKKRELITELSSKDNVSKRKAILALKEYVDLETIKEIEKLFNDEDASVRYFAKKIVKEIKDKLNINEISSIPKESVSLIIEEETIATALKSQEKESSTEQVKRILNDNDPELKIKTLEKLFANADKSILPVIIDIIKSESNVKLISLMVRLIGKIGGEEYIQTVITFLDNEDLRVKANAIEALEFIGTTSIIPHIIPFLNSDDNRIKANAIKAISRFHPNEMLQILSQMVKSEKVWMRDSAIFTLGQIKSNESIELLNDALYDNDTSISEHAFQVLSKFELPLAKKYIENYNSQTFQDISSDFSISGTDTIAQTIITPNDCSDNENVINSIGSESKENKKYNTLKQCPRCKDKIDLNSEICDCGYKFTATKFNDVADVVKNITSKMEQSITSTPEEIKICPRCNIQNKISRKTCSKCGFKFPHLETPQPENEIKIKYCSECGHEFSDNLINCPECGFEFQSDKLASAKITEEIRNCPECGFEFSDGQKDCPECGFEFPANQNKNNYAAIFLNSAKNFAANVVSNENIQNIVQKSKSIANESALIISANVTKAVSKGNDLYNASINTQHDNTNKLDNNLKICPECGFEQELHQLSCLECGYDFNVATNELKNENNSKRNIVCPECGFESDTNDKTCPECGCELNIVSCQNQYLINTQNTLICPECNQPIETGNSCNNCGFELENNTVKKVQVFTNESTLNANEKECPYCAEIIKKAAIICKHCHSKLDN